MHIQQQFLPHDSEINSINSLNEIYSAITIYVLVIPEEYFCHIAVLILFFTYPVILSIDSSKYLSK